MTAKFMTLDEIVVHMREREGYDEADLQPAIGVMKAWLDRGDGIAVYENHDMSHPQLGHRQYVSYGSPAAQLEVDTPPDRLPDIGGRINWRYTLVGYYRPEKS